VIRKCTECGAAFRCSPSDKTVTCSAECRSKRRSRLLTGRKRPDEIAAKIAAAARKQDRSDVLSRGTPAAQASTKGGRFATNSSAKSWTLISPEGVQNQCTNLMQFIRDHAADFGIAADDDTAVKRIHAGFRNVKQLMKHGSGCTIYGWTLVEWDDRKNCEK
jgi:hypothetical protein